MFVGISLVNSMRSEEPLPFHHIGLLSQFQRLELGFLNSDRSHPKAQGAN